MINGIPTYTFQIEVNVKGELHVFKADVPRPQVEFNVRNGRPSRIKRPYAEALVRKQLQSKNISADSFMIVSTTYLR